MSIGKSSIARAVNATATAKTQSANNTVCSITNFLLDNIGTLSIAKKCEDTQSIKQSISKRGILCPVVVAVTATGDAWLIDGYRRFAAAKELGLNNINAVIVNVENKSEANRIYTELYKTKPVIKTENNDNIHEEKFRVLAVKDHDLPTYLL